MAISQGVHVLQVDLCSIMNLLELPHRGLHHGLQGSLLAHLEHFLSVPLYLPCLQSCFTYSSLLTAASGV